MGSEWPEVSLDQVAKLRNGAGVKQEFFSESGVPLARVSDFTEDSIDIKDCKFVKYDHARKWENHFISKGDVIVATVGSWPPNWSSVVGKVIRAPKQAVGAIQNQNTCCVKPNIHQLNNRFLFYRLKLEDFVWHAANSAGGSANQARLPVKRLGRFTFHLPPLAEQKNIAHVLGSLDDRIELNQQMNETLESMAQALFKSWFVDFDPVIDNALASGKEIPEELQERAQTRAALGDKRQPLLAEIRTLFPDEFVYSDEQEWIPKQWGTSPLGDEIDFATGPAFKSKDFSAQGIKLARGMNVKEGHFKWGENTRYWSEISEDMKKHELKSGDVLIGMDGSKVGKNWVRVSFSDLPCLLVQRVARLRPKNTVGSTFLEVLIGGGMFKRYVENVKTGTTILHISGGQIKNYPIVNPCDEGVLFREFESMLGATAKKREENLAQTNTLIKLRDTLLPKLLSGKIRIPDAEKMVEELTL